MTSPKKKRTGKKQKQMKNKTRGDGFIERLADVDGEMWCYQKPGFEALLLAELQRQQQCSQFCDTLLKTEGVAVPAHSCILSAISPDISSALTSTPPPPAGQSRLLEFRALGACTLLRVVRLLYSGEMAGEGEEEKQEAISAAARLGIHGLVEVTRTDCKHRHEEEGQHADVGVQTEPLTPEENEGRRGRWRREVRDGSTFLWKETLSDGERDTWTQTEELQADTAPPPHPAASYETIDIAAFQTLGQTHPNLIPPQIPYVPISLVYPLDENQTHQPSSALVAPLYTSSPPSHLPFPNQATPSAADPPSCWAGPERAAAEECDDEQLEQFQDNIPGYINYFLNPSKEEGPCRGRTRGRQGARVGGARRAGTCERRAGRPRAIAGGRGRRGLTQTVDVQEVGVSRLQKLFLQRGGVRASRTGQGGGAAGRKLYLRTRELLKQTKSCQRRRGRSKVWESGLCGDVPPFCKEEAGIKQRGRRSTAPQFNPDGPPVGRAQKARTKPTTSVSFSSPPMQVYNVRTLPASSPSLKPSPSPALLSLAAPHAPRESSFLHTASVPPAAPPPHEEQPEHFDRLLEEVMMGLDILPNNSNGARHSQLPLPSSSSSSSSRTYGNTLAQNKQQSCNSGLLEAGPGFHGSTQVVAVGGGGSSSANSMVPILQQQGEGELNEMLEHFLMSFEQHVDSCAPRDEVEMVGQSRAEAPVRSSQKLQQSDGAETPATQPRKASAHNAAPPKHNEKTPSVSKRQKKRRKNEYPFSSEKKRVRVKKPVSSSDAKTKIVHDRGDKQLQQIPVVKLERSGLLPVKVALQGHSCQSLDLKSVAKAKTSSSSVKCPHDNDQRASWSTKTYPIRSRFREAHMDSTPFLEEPFVPKPQPGRKRGRPRKNGQLPRLCNGESSTPPIQPQPVDEQLEKNQERREEEFTVQPQEEAEGPTRRGEKRGAESKGETSDDAAVAKKVCSEKTPQPTTETCRPVSVQFEPAATEIEEVIDVETVSLTGVGDCLQGEEQEEKPMFSVIGPGEAEERLTDEDAESSGDEIIDVDGDFEKECHQSGAAPTLCRLTEEKPSVSPPSHSAKEVVLGSTGSWEEDKDEDIDVIGGSSPVPDPVIISWTEPSEGEEEEGDEEVDVIGEKTDYTSSVVFAAVSKGELVNRKYQTEVRLD